MNCLSDGVTFFTTKQSNQRKVALTAVDLIKREVINSLRSDTNYFFILIKSTA